MFAKLGNGTVRDLTLDTNTVYTHPATKQCTWNPDLSNYMVAKTISKTKAFSASGRTSTITEVLSVAELAPIADCLCANIRFSVQFSAINTTGGYFELRSKNESHRMLVEYQNLSSSSNYFPEIKMPMYREDNDIFVHPNHLGGAVPATGFTTNTALEVYLSLYSGGGDISGSITINITAF